MLCEHGDEGHVAVHEAGHAIAAFERGIPFERAAVFRDRQMLRDGVYAAGGVRLDEERGWRQTPALPLFEFVLAGRSAEMAVLGHMVPRGWDEDITIWRQVNGLFKAASADVYDAVLGEPVIDVDRRMRRWAAERFDAISAVAAALRGGDVLDETDVALIVERSIDSRAPGLPSLS